MEKSLSNKLQEKDLHAKILRRVAAGKEGAIKIFCAQINGECQLRLWRSAGVWPVVHLRISLITKQGPVHLCEEDFDGELLIDDHGGGDQSVRLVMLDHLGQVVISTDQDVLIGSVMIVAVPDKDGAEPFTFFTLFEQQNEDMARSAALWDISPEWLFFADMIQILVDEKCAWGS